MKTVDSMVAGDVCSREYKMMLDVSWFADLNAGLDESYEDVVTTARKLGLDIRGEFDKNDPSTREIRFMDTPGLTLQKNTLILRQRVKKEGKTEYTLKCRSEDRYLTAATCIEGAAGLEGKDKFEEDIAPPFVSRFSHSVTVEASKAGAPGQKRPATLRETARFFPCLLELQHDDHVCPADTALASISERPVFERVFDEPTIFFKDTEIGTLGVILWSREKKGRIVTAELSFRHDDLTAGSVTEIAPVLHKFFRRLQTQPWASAQSLTKTQFMYSQA